MSPPTTVVPAVPVVPPLPDPEQCQDGGRFERLTPELWVCGRAGGGPPLVTLFPVTNAELVRLVMGPYAPMFISTIIPRETGHRWQPQAVTQTPWCSRAGPDMGPCTPTVNSSNCVSWVQLCGKQGLAAQLGYTWYEAEYAYPALVMARWLVNDSVARHQDPYSHWRCGRCSLR